MKKSLFVGIISMLVVTSVFGVTRLTYEQHALKPEVNNDMILTAFQNPGMAGANQVWDFSELKDLKAFNGTIQWPNYIKSAFFSNNFNTELIEFGNSFYFDITENKIEMTGFRSGSGNTEIAYNKPFVKMVYPFVYGNSFNGTFDGSVKAGSRTGVVNGIYDVEADAYGKLILPNNEVVEDALRVKTIKSYTQTFGNSSSDISITTYRWYTQNVRYPVLVFITTEYGTGDNKNVSHTAAYKSGINDRIENASVLSGKTTMYPNPFSGSFYVSYEIESEARVKVEMYDMVGKKIAVLTDEVRSVGNYEDKLNVDAYGLKNGMYTIRTTIAGVENNQQMLLMK